MLAVTRMRPPGEQPPSLGPAQGPRTGSPRGPRDRGDPTRVAARSHGACAISVLYAAASHPGRPARRRVVLGSGPPTVGARPSRTAARSGALGPRARAHFVRGNRQALPRESSRPAAEQGNPTRGAFKPAPCSCAVHRPAPAAGAQLGARSARVCSANRAVLGSAPLIVQSSGLLPFQRNSARTVLGSAPI